MVQINALKDSFRDDLISVGDFIMKGVNRGSQEKPDEQEKDQQVASCSSGSSGNKRAATAGSVGDFLAKRKK